jgi:hypothetical protein
MNAIINDCLKPVASTLPLATDEIKKIHGYKFFIKADAMHAHGIGSPWDVALPVKFNRLPSIKLWTTIFRHSIGKD